MTDEAVNNKDDFISPTSKYYGKFSPGNLAFNSNLQEFAQKVSFVCGLETNGKISTEDAYNRIKEMWHQLEQSKRELLDNTELNREE